MEELWNGVDGKPVPLDGGALAKEGKIKKKVRASCEEAWAKMMHGMPVMEEVRFSGSMNVFTFSLALLLSLALADMRIPILFRSASRFGGRGGLDRGNGWFHGSLLVLRFPSIIRWAER